MLSPLLTEPALLAGLSAIAVLLVITWVVDLLDLRRKRASQPGYSKRKAYARTMLMLWTTAALCVAAWLGSGALFTALRCNNGASDVLFTTVRRGNGALAGELGSWGKTKRHFT